MSIPKFRVSLFALAFLAFSVLAFADSQVRIVRLSTAEGTVQVDRNTGAGFEKAVANLPVTQGMKLRTQSDGRAEVEFEDGSTLRLAPDTAVNFPQLSLRDSGTKVSDVNLQTGTLYVDFGAAKDNELTLSFGHEKLAFSHAAHLRVEMAPDGITVAVFKGDVQIQGPSGAINVAKNRTAVFDLNNDEHATLAKDLEPDPYDAWDKQQEQYHERYTVTASNAYSPYAYGVADLNYYGNFFSVPGYGTMWQPYFVGAGWDPFMNGAWAFNPGFGFGWVSSYPWGWTPYHYGSWIFVPNYGWAWQPGGTWVGLNTLPKVVNPPRRFAAPQPPANGNQMVVVNRGPLPILEGRSGNKLVIRNDSAGLGVPRGGIKNMGQVSQSVAQTGAATTRVHAAPIDRGTPRMRGSFEEQQHLYSRPSSAGVSSMPSAPPPAPVSRPTSGGVRH
ncbi:MAG: hypothetical protein NVS1B11_15350 [Terriglobales bacterium]